MPIHDWTGFEAGDFHHFHLSWVVAIADALNGGLLPEGYLAILEFPGRPIPDAATREALGLPEGPDGGIVSMERMIYARRADRVAIRHGLEKVVAIIEILSPGHKDSRHAIRSFVETAVDILNQGVNLLVIDLFPPTPRDPQGIHKAIWDELCDEPFETSPGKPLIVASYVGGDIPEAYVESVGIGDALPSLPIFLSETRDIPAPLETTYQEAWADFPAVIKQLIEPAGNA